MSLSNIHTIMKTMKENELKFKKKYGQNFLIDQNILDNICKESSIDKTTGIIEIGTGLGSLTEVIANYAKRVVSYEIDSDLIPILNKNFNNTNVTIINQDILKVSIDETIEKYFNDCQKIYVVSNLPYYITTPILTYLLSTTERIDSFTLMMQKEVADKILTKENAKNLNVLSFMIEYKMNCKKLFNIPKTVFYPSPNVDSSVILLSKKIKLKVANNEKSFYELLQKAFVQRRKTLLNNLLEGYNFTREEWNTLFETLNINPTQRSETTSLNQFIEISNLLEKKGHKS